MDTYLGPPDVITHDFGTNFASQEFRQNATAVGTVCKPVPVEAHHSIGKIERRHVRLLKAYATIQADLEGHGIKKEDLLQMAVKACNDSTGPDGLIPTLLVFGAFPRMSLVDPPSPDIAHRAKAVASAMRELRKLQATAKVNSALGTRNGPNTWNLHGLPLQSPVKVWRAKGNGRPKGVWTGPHTLLSMEGETIKVRLTGGKYPSTSFRSTSVQPYYEVEGEDMVEPPPNEGEWTEGIDEGVPLGNEQGRNPGPPGFEIARQNPILTASEEQNDGYEDILTATNARNATLKDVLAEARTEKAHEGSFFSHSGTTNASPKGVLATPGSKNANSNGTLATPPVDPPLMNPPPEPPSQHQKPEAPYALRRTAYRLLKEAKESRTETTVYLNGEPVMIFLTQKKKDNLELSKDLRDRGIILTPGKSFEASRKKEVEGLLATGVHEMVKYDPTIMKGRIFNSRFVDEIKARFTDSPTEKSRLVIQGFNDLEKAFILTQSPTVQRMSHRLLMALAPSLMRDYGMALFLRDIHQAFTKSTTPLNREVYAWPPKDMKGTEWFPEGYVMRLIRPLYGLAEAGAHWYVTYSTHMRVKLDLRQSTYDACLLISKDKAAKAVKVLQMDDTLFAGDKAFAAKEAAALVEAKFGADETQELKRGMSMTFNGGTLVMDDDDFGLTFKAKGQVADLKLINIDSSLEDMMVEYVQQRARGAYIASMCQPEAFFDLSSAAQNQDPTVDEAKLLNQRLQWQIDNPERGLHFVPLDLSAAKLFVFVDGSFANNKDLSSQIGYTVVLANEIDDKETTNEFRLTGNLVHYSSVKCRRLTRSVLASELYGTVRGADIGLTLGSTLQLITEMLDLPKIPVIICMDSQSVYNTMVKLGTTDEKRLMIDIMGLRESYENREVMEFRRIKGDDNPADAMTEKDFNPALTELIDTNKLRVRCEAWVKRPPIANSYAVDTGLTESTGSTRTTETKETTEYLEDIIQLAMVCL